MIGKQIYRSNFLIVPHLSKQINLRKDWLLKNRVIINYDSRNIAINGVDLSNSIFQIGNKISREISRENQNDEIQYIQMLYIDDVIPCNGRAVGGEHKSNDKRVSSVSVDVSSKSEFNIPKNFYLKSAAVDRNLTNSNNKQNHKDKFFSVYEDGPKNDIIFFNFVNESVYYEGNYAFLDQYQVNSIEHQNSFIEDINKMASKVQDISMDERKAFVKMMSKFEYLFAQKNCSADVVPYVIRIEKCNVSYLNPIRIVIKSNGTVRICLDARFINAIIETDHQAPPLIYELIQKFHNVSFMTTTDLTSGYWQIPLHPASRKYTAFLYNSQMYQFCRLPFGLRQRDLRFYKRYILL